MTSAALASAPRPARRSSTCGRCSSRAGLIAERGRGSTSIWRPGKYRTRSTMEPASVAWRTELLRDAVSDGYATGLVTLVLEQAAMPRAREPVQHGRSWLVRNQRGHGGLWVRGQEGFWVTHSLNKRRNPSSNVGLFMSDAATAYAVLALTR